MTHRRPSAKLDAFADRNSCDNLNLPGLHSGKFKLQMN